MRRKVGEWTAVQTVLPKDEAGDKFWNRLEHRTFGKLGHSSVAIQLDREEQVMVDAALEQITVNGEIQQSSGW